VKHASTRHPELRKFLTNALLEKDLLDSISVKFEPSRSVIGTWFLWRRFLRPLARKLTSRLRVRYVGDENKLEIHAGETSATPQTRNVLIVSHDLSASGAPQVVLNMASVLIEARHNVFVVSPSDGPIRMRLQQAGASVVLWPHVFVDPILLTNLVEVAHIVICNTVVTRQAIQWIGGIVPTYWYLHEVSLLRDLLAEKITLRKLLVRSLRKLLARPTQIWAGSELSAALVRPYRADAIVFPYGLEPLIGSRSPSSVDDGPLTIAVFGSFESRKGQDLAVAAVAQLPPKIRSQLRLRLFGRTLSKTFYHELVESAAAIPEVAVHGELEYEEYLRELLAADAILVPSRDDTLPLVSLDALSGGRLLLCTRTTGTSAFITHGINGFVAEAADICSIGSVLREAIERRVDWPQIATAGYGLYQAQFSRKAFAKALLTHLGLSELEVRVEPP
jgi:glycosyltransferase involved in cell wall biosynthesis